MGAASSLLAVDDARLLLGKATLPAAAANAARWSAVKGDGAASSWRQ